MALSAKSDESSRAGFENHRPERGANMTITGKTRVYAILGDPLANARSPEGINALFAERGLDAVLVPAEVDAAGFDAAVVGFKQLKNCWGLILTMPHKQAMLKHVDLLRDNGRLIGAVNATRRLEDGRWEGDMFDGLGYVGALRARGIDPAGKRVHMMGAGGVARAMVLALAEAGAASITLRDLEAQRAQELARAATAAFPRLRAEAVAEDRFDCDILANATPLGMRPQDPPACDPERIDRRTIVTDVIPKPEMTPLLNAAHARDCTIVTGREMFQAQVGMVAEFLEARPKHR
jgi:shikimate dehydrogenase